MKAMANAASGSAPSRPGPVQHEGGERDAHALRQALRHGGEAGGVAHLPMVEIGKGERVDAHRLERAEDPAEEQDGEHQDVRHFRADQRTGRGKGARDERVPHEHIAEAEAFRIRAETLRMPSDPTAETKVISPEWKGE